MFANSRPRGFQGSNIVFFCKAYTVLAYEPSDVQREGLEAERRWTGAFLEGDVERLAALMDDEYHQVQADGSVKTKQQVLASFSGGRRSWERAESDEHLVKLYGDTAVVVGRWRAKGGTWGETFDYVARFVSVYVRRSEGWRMVMDQSTPLGGETNG